MELEHKSYKARVESAGEAGEITALVSVFGNVDRAKEVVRPGAFAASLSRRMPKGVWAHDWSKPIAKTLEARETPEGLVIRGQFNLDTQSGREAYSNIKFGIIDEFSIGYKIVKESRDSEKGTRNLDELELFEWSPVLVGMNEDTRLLSIKNAANATEAPVMSAQEAMSDEDMKPIRPRFPGAPQGNWGGNLSEAKSYGQRFIESKEYQEYLRSHSTGQESGSLTLDIGLKAVMTTTTSWAPETTRSGLSVPYATRPLQVVDIMPTVQTQQNAYVYMEQTTFTNTAAETAEGAAKPEAALALTERTSPVRKIPVYIPVTDEQLEDVPGIQEWIENQLAFMVRQRLDSQLLVGDGLGVNLRGILNVVGIQTQAKGADPTPDAIFKAMTKIRVTGRAMPSAVIIHPNDWQEVQLLRTTEGIYLAGSPWDSGPERIWGLPVVQTDAITEGTAVVGDFVNYSLLVERKSLTIKVGYNADDFTKNQRTIVAEVRVAAVWLRPQAFASVTGI